MLLIETLAMEIGLAVKYRRMEEQIFRKNKLIELGTIAAGVAHEIRNPLNAMRLNLHVLLRQLPLLGNESNTNEAPGTSAPSKTTTIAVPHRVAAVSAAAMHRSRCCSSERSGHTSLATL